MEISVWDTYVKRGDGKIMHFDILVPSKIDNRSLVFAFGQKYLSEKSFETGELSTKECKFCHIEKATEEVEKSIINKGYFILEMDNCN